MSISDPHEDCVWCLSSDPDVEECSSCRRMNPKALKEREAKLFKAKKQKRGRRRSRSRSKSPTLHTSRSSKKHKNKRRHGSLHCSSKDAMPKSVSPGPRRHWKDEISPSPPEVTPARLWLLHRLREKKRLHSCRSQLLHLWLQGLWRRSWNQMCCLLKRLQSLQCRIRCILPSRLRVQICRIFVHQSGKPYWCTWWPSGSAGIFHGRFATSFSRRHLLCRWLQGVGLFRR